MKVWIANSGEQYFIHTQEPEWDHTIEEWCPAGEYMCHCFAESLPLDLPAPGELLEVNLRPGTTWVAP